MEILNKLMLKFLRKLKTDDMYMNEEEVLQLGVIDEIVTNMDVLY